MIRRDFLKNTTLAGAALGLSSTLVASDPTIAASPLKGNINHSVARWCYGYLSLDDLCKEVKRIGFSAIDLLGPKEWEILKSHGVDSSMCNGAEINLTDGWNDKNYHDQLIKNYYGCVS